MTIRLQDEIKQTKPFARPSDEALLSILRTATVLEHGSNEVLRPFGITSTQYNVLRILRGAGAGGLCGKEIAERLDLAGARRLAAAGPHGGDGAAGEEAGCEGPQARDGADHGEGAQGARAGNAGAGGVRRGRVERLSARTVEGLVEALAAIREGA